MSFTNLIQIDHAGLALSLTQFESQIKELQTFTANLEQKVKDDNDLLDKYKQSIIKEHFTMNAERKKLQEDVMQLNK